MDKAKQVASEGLHSVTTPGEGDWTVGFYDIGNDNDFDALFICSRRSEGGNRGIVVVYSVGDADKSRRQFYATELQTMWD